jgi:hypothetical protein
LATAKVTGDAGVQTLQVRRNNDDYFAKSSAVDGIYKVDSSLGQALDKKIEDFRQKKPAATPAPPAMWRDLRFLFSSRADSEPRQSQC